jgi:hypothetical protein
LGGDAPRMISYKESQLLLSQLLLLASKLVQGGAKPPQT